MTKNAKCNKSTLQLTHQNLKVINSHFMTVSGHFFANYMIIFHKTEIQTVILRCYDTKGKIAKNKKKEYLLQNCKKSEMEIFAFLTIDFEPNEICTCYTPQNYCLNLSFVKVICMVGHKMAKNGGKIAIYESVLNRISLYLRECTTNSKSCRTVSVYGAAFTCALRLGGFHLHSR